MDADDEYALRARQQRKLHPKWWRPSVEDYYSPFDPHFDYDSDSDDSDNEEDELEVMATRGDFASISTELLVRISGFLDLESLCRGTRECESLLYASFASNRIYLTALVFKFVV